MTKMMILAAAMMFSTAANADEPVRVSVSTQNIDLASAEGRAELDRRAHRAAVDACGTRSAVDIRGAKVVKQCRLEVAEKVRRAAASTRMAGQ